MSYAVFHRTWWRENKTWPNGLEPCCGRRTHIAYAETEAEARAICRVWNEENEPGRLSRKAEYQQE